MRSTVNVSVVSWTKRCGQGKRLAIAALGLAVLLLTQNSKAATARVVYTGTSPGVDSVFCKSGFTAPQCYYRAYATPATGFESLNGNLAQGRPVVASSYLPGYEAIHHPSYATDGKYGNGSSWITNNNWSWISIDLGQVKWFDQVRFGRDRLGYYDDRDPGHFVIDGSNDGSNFVTILNSWEYGFSGSIYYGQSVTTYLPPQHFRFVRVQFERPGTAIDEIEVFAPIPFSSMTVGSTTAQYGGTATLSATLTASTYSNTPGPLAGRSVLFTIDGSSVGWGTTDSAGTAQIATSIANFSAGSHTILAFSYADGTHGGVNAIGYLTITKAVPTIAWPSPSPVRYGTPLTGLQLNASSSIAGSLTYSPPAGTVLPEGAHSLIVTLTPADSTNYESASATRTITVLPPAQTIVVGKPAFFARAGVGTVINFEDQPANAPLAPDAYVSRGVWIGQLDGLPLYVGQWAYSEQAMIVPSGTKGISSSWAGAQHNSQFSTICNSPPSCVLFWNNAASDRIRFTFTTPVKAAGIHLGQNDYAGIRVAWFDAAGAVIASRQFAPFEPWSDFVGLVDAATPIASMVVENGANDGDGVYFDDLMFVPATAGDMVAQWGWHGATGGTADALHPALVRSSDGGALRDVVAVSGGKAHTLALHADGTVSAWGENTYGQSGDGLSDLKDIVAVAAGWEHSLALDQSGRVWSWGRNDRGQLGDGTAGAPRARPALVPGLSGITSIDAREHTLVVRYDGTLWAWGPNNRGQLGDGTVQDRYSPIQSPGINAVVTTAAGWQHSLALTSSGLVFGTGGNYAGQVGPTSGGADLPTWTQISGLTNVVSIGAGDIHSVALRSDGTVWSLGGNSEGQLGDGTTTQRSAIVQAAGIADIVAISTGMVHTLALQSDGTIWAWGHNGLGAIGDGNTTNALLPVRVSRADGDSARATQIEAGSFHSLSLGTFTLGAALSRDAIDFGKVPVGQASAASTVILTNTGTAELAVARIESSGAFIVSSPTCGGGNVLLPPGATCALNVVFIPSTGAAQTARLLVYTDAPGSPHAVDLTGVGVEDLAAPTITFVETPMPSVGWHRGAGIVNVMITATDDATGVKRLSYVTTGAQEGNQSTFANLPLSLDQPVEISAEGVTTVTASAEDLVGNVSAESTHTVRIDRTAPTVNITFPQQGAVFAKGIPQRHIFSCADSLAGIASCYTPSTGGEFIDTFTSGTKTFSVTATDFAGNVATQTVTYIVNVPPVAQTSTATVAEDVASDIVLNATDPDGSRLTYSIVQAPLHGTIDAVRLLPAGGAVVTYTPARDFNGTDSVTFTVKDDIEISQPGTVQITVTPVNDRPQVVLQATRNFAGHFESGTQFTVGKYPMGTPAIADFNGDGKADVAVANNQEDSLSILLGDGIGNFAPHKLYAAGKNPAWLTAGDFNGDGRMDVAVANQTSLDVLVFLGNSDGSLKMIGGLPGIAGLNQIRAVDVDSDGKLDLVAVSYYGGGVFMRGKGDGTFASPLTLGPANAGAFGVATGDINRDGVIDLVTANREGKSLAVFLGGVFSSGPEFIAESGGPFSVELADFNGDGLLDLVSGQHFADNLAIRLGNGDGTFAPALYFTADVTPLWMTAADLNVDGRRDLIVTNSGSANVSVLLGHGDGTFDPPVNYATGGNPRGVAVGDLNGDGGLDLVTANMTEGTVSVLLQRGELATLPYTEGQSPLLVAPGASVVDPDFKAGRLVVTIGNASTADALTVLDSSSVIVDGSNVTVGGIPVAKLSGGIDGAPLELTFDSTASLPAVEAVLQRVAFTNSSENPVSGPRSISFTLTDAEGAESDPAAVDVTVVAVNDAPVAVATVTSNPAEAVNATGADVQLDANGSSDAEDGALTFTWRRNGIALGTGASLLVKLPIADHTIELIATDPEGATGTTSVMVSVRDTRAPVITLTHTPRDLVVEATGPEGAVVAWPAPAALDAVDGPSTVTCSPPAGTMFKLGSTAVTCSAADSRGNTSVERFTVTVRDTTAPTVTVPNGVIAEATSASGAAVFYEATASDVVGTSSPVCVPSSGSTFALGLTTVTCTARDNAGNVATASFGVTVRDTTPPALSLPAPLLAEAMRPDGAVVTYAATANDLVSGPIAVSCSPPSGSVFPLGSTAVRCSATDAAGNRAEDLFVITVVDRTGPSLTIVSPSADTVIDSSQPPVYVDATDAVGVTRVTINGVDAARISGTPDAGRWTANVPVTVPSGNGASVTFTAIAFDAVGHPSNSAPLIVDSDGIAGSIDRRRSDGADQSRAYSSEFVHGVTVGTILDRAGWTVRALPHFDVVELALQSVQTIGGTAKIAVCGGSYKELQLDRQNENAQISCSSTGTLAVRAVNALPRIELRKLVTATSGWFRPRTYQYWSQISIATGQRVSTGSPLVADPENTEPITATLLQIDESGSEIEFGTLVLDPGESADVSFTEGAEGQDDIANITALAGRVEVTIAGQTSEIGEGEPYVAVVDRTAPVMGEIADVIAEATSAAGATVTFGVPVADNVDAAPLVVTTPASGSVFPMGDTTVTVTATDRAGNAATKTFTVTVRDTTAPEIVIATPAETTYLLNQPVMAAYHCSDGASGIEACTGTATAGAAVDTTQVGAASFTVTGRDRAGNSATRTAPFTVAYGVTTLHDDTKAVRAGATLPIKMRLVDHAGVNQSAAGLAVVAADIVLLSTGSTTEVQDAGNANPDFNFRYDAGLGGYIFNLKTTGLASGVYGLQFRAGGDPTVHMVRFQVR